MILTAAEFEIERRYRIMERLGIMYEDRAVTPEQLAEVEKNVDNELKDLKPKRVFDL